MLQMISAIKRHILIVIIALATSLILFSSALTAHVISDSFSMSVEREAETIAETIHARIVHYYEMIDFIDGLLAEKISGSSSYLLENTPEINHDYLVDYASTYHIDVINWISPLGEVIASSDALYHGEMIDEDHPLYTFVHSSAESMFEPIRLDQLLNVARKFAIYRDSSGYMLQLGVGTRDIEAISLTLSIQSIMDNVASHDYIGFSRFIAPDLRITAHNDDTFVNTIVVDPYTVSMVEKRLQGFRLHYHNLEELQTYSVFHPIYYQNTFVGMLNIGFLPESTTSLINRVMWVVFTGTTLAFIFLITTLLYANKQRLNMSKLALTDQATGLPNRDAFESWYKKSYSLLKYRHAVIYLIDIADFRRLTEIHGFHFGDALLHTIAKHISSLAPPESTLYRFTNHDFLLVDMSGSPKEMIDSLSSLFLSSIQKPMTIDQIDIIPSGHIGIYHRFYENDQYLDVVRMLYLALYRAQEKGINAYALYDKTLRDDLKRESQIENILRKALEGNDDHYLLSAVFQPIINAKTEQVFAFETLARLHCDTLGDITPDEFIAVAEKRQIIVPLGQHMLAFACAFSKELEMNGFIDPLISINVSYHEINHPLFVKHLLEILKKYELNPKKLVIELTESVFAHNPERLTEVFDQLKRLGIKVGLDDFGKEYSSIGYLRHKNIDIIKIDKSFIDDIMLENYNSNLLKGIISISKTMGLYVLGEGVEHQKQVEQLKDLGCHFLQGYVFSRPLKPKDAINYLKR